MVHARGKKESTKALKRHTCVDWYMKSYALYLLPSAVCVLFKVASSVAVRVFFSFMSCQ